MVSSTVGIPGLGEDVPGLTLEKFGTPLHWIGDSAAFAQRAWADSTWALYSASKDSVVPGEGVHWIRVAMEPDSSLCGMPLMIVVRVEADVQLFHNGAPLAQSSKAIRGRGLTAVPFSFACDGKAETMAVRLALAPGTSLEDAGFLMSLHRQDIFFRLQGAMVHTGIFIGLNLMLLVFALVMWAAEERQRWWLILAALSFLSMVGALLDSGLFNWAMGANALIDRLAIGIQFILAPLRLYLLVMLLATLHGTLTRKPFRRYTLGVVVATFFTVAFAVLLSTVGEFSVSHTDGAWKMALAVILVLGLLFAVVVMIWFSVAALRWSIRLVRARGYARWVGVGALLSLLASFLLGGLSIIFMGNWSVWTAVVGDYFGNVGVPLSVAVYLAMRSAHHNKLVRRQRDELDEEVKERTAELRAEKERSEELLLNILPGQVADELKAKGEADARSIGQVTVLFTDFKGFTRISERMAPKELVADIHECFSAFDAIMEKHGVEKIKTIGDSYMAAGGLPVPNTTHARDVVLAALEVQAFIAALGTRKQAAGQPFFEIRIGVHTGPVVAGIVGVKKFQYDIWGDTVNTASRMESSGAVGRVNISEATYILVKDVPGLAFTARGPVEVKGKGAMPMWFVERA